MSNGDSFSFEASDGLTYTGSASELRAWYEEGRIALDDLVTDDVTGVAYVVRDIVGQRASGTTGGRSSAYPASGSGHSYVRPAKIENHLGKALFSAICCGCLPLGVVAVVYAAQVDGYWNRGDYYAAQDASDKASAWANWSIGLGVVWLILWLLTRAATG